MHYNPRPRPPLDDEKVDELARYLEEELQAISRVLTGETGEVALTPLAVEPLKPREGLLVLADGTNWDPGSGPGLYVYRLGSGWTFLEETGASDLYATITDGTSGATAVGASTIKFRGSDGLVPTVSNDDPTHGDNVLYSQNYSLLPFLGALPGLSTLFNVRSGGVQKATTFQEMVDGVAQVPLITGDPTTDTLLIRNGGAGGGALKRMDIDDFLPFKLVQSFSGAEITAGVNFSLPSGYAFFLGVAALQSSVLRAMIINLTQDGGSPLTFNGRSFSATISLFTNSNTLSLSSGASPAWGGGLFFLLGTALPNTGLITISYNRSGTSNEIILASCSNTVAAQSLLLTTNATPLSGQVDLYGFKVI